MAETSGKNAIVVTPSADLDLAAKDVALSAFGHAGQKCSAASLVILVGSVATSKRFRRQLVDAVTSLHVGRPWEESAQVGPLIGPAEGKLLRALTTLGPGESWVVEPQSLDAEGDLWRPGVREGVRPGAEFHHVEYFGPVLGIMTADSLDEAIDLVNDIDYGLASGLQSLDEEEIARWLERVEAGNLYVNRGITGAIVQRQPFGGWKRSSVGPGAKAGGPNYLIGLGTWTDRPVEAEEPKDPVSRAALVAARAAGVSDDDLAWLAGALHTDVQAWDEEFGVVRDRTGLTAEHNALRYHPIPVTLRHEGTRVVELVRLVAAGARAGSPMTVSAGVILPDSVQAHLRAVGAELRHDDRDGWHALARELAQEGARVRLVGASAAEVVEATDGSPALAVFDGEVVTAGRVELLTFLREQVVSITAHRFGTPRPRLVRPAVPGPKP